MLRPLGRSQAIRPHAVGIRCLAPQTWLSAHCSIDADSGSDTGRSRVRTDDGACAVADLDLSPLAPGEYALCITVTRESRSRKRSGRSASCHNCCGPRRAAHRERCDAEPLITLTRFTVVVIARVGETRRSRNIPSAQRHHPRGSLIAPARAPGTQSDGADRHDPTRPDWEDRPTKPDRPTSNSSADARVSVARPHKRAFASMVEDCPRQGVSE